MTDHERIVKLESRMSELEKIVLRLLETLNRG